LCSITDSNNRQGRTTLTSVAFRNFLANSRF